MTWSILSRVADWFLRRPEWPERDGDRVVLVRGYSPLDNLGFGLFAAGLILVPTVCLLVTLP